MTDNLIRLSAREIATARLAAGFMRCLQTDNTETTSMTYWSGLKASIKSLKALRATETDSRRVARIDAEIAAKQALLNAR